MSIIDDVDELAAKEREIRRLERLITLLSSLDEAEFSKLGSRIIAQRKVIARSKLNAGSAPTDVMFTLPPAKRLAQSIRTVIAKTMGFTVRSRALPVRREHAEFSL